MKKHIKFYSKLSDKIRRQFRIKFLDDNLERVTYHDKKRSLTAFIFSIEDDVYLIIMDREQKELEYEELILTDSENSLLEKNEM